MRVVRAGGGVVSQLVRALLYALLLVVIVVTGIASYWTHKDGLQRWERVERLVTDPQARPDAWTKTQDQQHMLMFEAYFKDWIDANYVRKEPDPKQ